MSGEHPPKSDHESAPEHHGAPDPAEAEALRKAEGALEAAKTAGKEEDIEKAQKILEELKAKKTEDHDTHDKKAHGEHDHGGSHGHGHGHEKKPWSTKKKVLVTAGVLTAPVTVPVVVPGAAVAGIMGISFWAGIKGWFAGLGQAFKIKGGGSGGGGGGHGGGGHGGGGHGGGHGKSGGHGH